MELLTERLYNNADNIRMNAVEGDTGMARNVSICTTVEYDISEDGRPYEEITVELHWKNDGFEYGGYCKQFFDYCPVCGEKIPLDESEKV